MEQVYKSRKEGTSLHRKNRKLRLGVLGIITGALCVTIMYAVEVYGPGSYTTSGSGSLYADGTITMEVSRPLLPQIAAAAFFTCFVSLLFGIASLVRKEARTFSLSAVAFGIAPVLIYTLGTVLTFSLYAWLVLLIAGIELCRMLMHHNKQNQA